MVLKKVYAITAIEMLSMGLFMPLFAPHMRSLGCSNTIIGFLGSAGALIQFISNPVVGSLSDRFGRKPILVRALCGIVASNLCLAVWSTSVVGIFIARLFSALSSQSMVLVKAIVADTVPSDEQSAVYGKIGGFAAAGFVLGPIVGGVILGLNNGFFYLALLLTALAIFSTGIATLLPDSKPKSKPKQEIYVNLLGEISKTVTNLKSVKWDTYWDLFTFKLLNESSIQICFSSLGLILIESFSISQNMLGLTLSTIGIISVIFNVTGGTIKNNFYSHDNTGMLRTFHGFTLVSAAFLLMLFTNSYWVFLFCFMPLFGARTILDLTWTEVLVSRTAAADKGVVMGAFESLFQLAGLATPLIGGVLLDVFGNHGPAFVAIVPAVAGVIISRRVLQLQKENID